MVNTTLTAAGMWALAIPGLGLLSLFVFICSFIPIAGCFISTIPVAFVALTEYGFLKVIHSCSHTKAVQHAHACCPGCLQDHAACLDQPRTCERLLSVQMYRWESNRVN